MLVVIEHNLDVIKTAHWMALGPEGGVCSGEIIAVGAEGRRLTISVG